MFAVENVLGAKGLEWPWEEPSGDYRGDRMRAGGVT